MKKGAYYLIRLKKYGFIFHNGRKYKYNTGHQGQYIKPYVIGRYTGINKDGKYRFEIIEFIFGDTDTFGPIENHDMFLINEESIVHELVDKDGLFISKCKDCIFYDECLSKFKNYFSGCKLGVYNGNTKLHSTEV